ncbi:MAG: hypothetical protein ACYDBQ_03385 [Thermoplasmatota archaeon]
MRLDQGGRPATPFGPGSSSSPALEFRPAGPLGPSNAGEGAFRLADALASAGSQPNGTLFTQILACNGSLTSVDFYRWGPSPRGDPVGTWTLAASNGAASAQLTVTQRLGPGGAGGSFIVDSPTLTPGGALPQGRLPTVDSMWRVWRAYASATFASRQPNYWSYSPDGWKAGYDSWDQPRAGGGSVRDSSIVAGDYLGHVTAITERAYNFSGSTPHEAVPGPEEEVAPYADALPALAGADVRLYDAWEFPSHAAAWSAALTGAFMAFFYLVAPRLRQ